MLRRKSKATKMGSEISEIPTAGVYDLIARRAYELYESRGGGAGDELTDWLTAEREILGRAADLGPQPASGIGKTEMLGESEAPKKVSKLPPTEVARKKASTTTATRSPAKPKGAHP